MCALEECITGSVYEPVPRAAGWLLEATHPGLVGHDIESLINAVHQLVHRRPFLFNGQRKVWHTVITAKSAIEISKYE